MALFRGLPGVLGIVLAGGLVLGAAGCHKPEEPFTIAIMTKLESGSIVGTSEFNAGKLFLEERGIKDVVLAPFNDDWQPQKVAEAYGEVKRRGIRILVTSHTSACALAIKDQVNADHVLTFVAGATTDALSGQDDYILRNIQDVQLEQKAIADYVSAMPVKRVVILQDECNSAYTTPAAKYFGQHLQGKEVRVVAMSTDSLDAGALQGQLGQEPFDLVYLIVGGYRSNAAGALAQIALQANPDAVVMLTPWVKSPILVEAAGSAIGRCILPSHYPPRGQNSNVDAYVDSYKKRFGYAPTFISLNVYRALEILYQAIQSGCREPDAIKQYVLTQKTFETRFGPITFDAFGDTTMPLYFVTDISREF